METIMPKGIPLTKEEGRTRTCEDLNNCGLDNEMPNTTQDCEYNNKTLLWILLGGSVILLALVLFFGLKSPKKHQPIQEQTHNPHPDDEVHEHEMPTQEDFSEYQNKEQSTEYEDLSAIEEEFPMGEEPQKFKEKPSSPRRKNKGDFYLP